MRNDICFGQRCKGGDYEAALKVAAEASLPTSSARYQGSRPQGV